MRWFLTRAHRAEEHPSQPELAAEEVDGLLEILAPVAFHFATLPGGWTDLMSPTQLRTAVRCAGPAFTERNKTASDLVRELSVGAGMVVPAGNPAGGRPPGYLFLHRTFAEFLVAHHLAAQPEADWLGVVEQHMWFDPDWTEVIPLLGAQLDQDAARQRTGHLLSQKHDPFGHAMFTALRVIAERPDLDHLLRPEDVEKVAQQLLSMLDHSEAEGGALSALAAVTRLPRPLVDRLSSCLDGPDWRGQVAAAQALAGRSAPELAIELLEVLSGLPVAVDHRAALSRTIQGSDEETENLLALTRSYDSETQIKAVGALAHNYGPTVIDALIALIRDVDSPVRNAALRVLAERRTTPQMTDKLLELLGSREWYERAASAEALEGRLLSGRHAAEVANRLLIAAEDSDEDVQAAAALGLTGRDGSGNNPHPPLHAPPLSRRRQGCSCACLGRPKRICSHRQAVGPAYGQGRRGPDGRRDDPIRARSPQPARLTDPALE